jgi:hypothetical protein
MAVPWVPQRAVRAKGLMEQTGGEVIWDRTQNIFETWCSVMSAAREDPVIVLEDDIYLCDEWREKVEHEIAARPDSVIQFFSMRGKDLTEGSRLEPGRTYLMNQCHYLPGGTASALLTHAQTWRERRPDDEDAVDWIVAEWLQQQNLKYWLHVPSLVQHEPWRSEVNTRRPRNRQSSSFI